MQSKIFFSLLFSSCLIFAESTNEDKKIALAFVAAISDSIATLVVNRKEKDPEVTKACCVELVVKLADLIAEVIIRGKEQKAMRSVDSHVELSDQEYQTQLELIAENLAQSITQ